MSNPFPAPDCLVCDDSGERIEETPTSIGLMRETVPCDNCPTGLLLQAQMAETFAQYDLSHPITQDELNREDDRQAEHRENPSPVTLDGPPAFPIMETR